MASTDAGWARSRSAQIGAALAAATYGIFRLAVEIGMRGEPDRHPTGMLANDSYYPLAFARQMERDGSWLFFHNPYGSFDNSPGLYDGVAVLMRLLAPLWQHHLLAFDVAVGLTAAVVAGYFVGRIMGELSNQTAALTALALALVVCASGVGFIAHDLGIGPDASQLRWGTSWGVNWMANQLATWELVYHAIFWAGAWSLVRYRRRGACTAGGALALLHPFTLGIYVLFALSVWAAHVNVRDRGASQMRAIALPLAATAVFAGVIYQAVFPHFSRDANFLHRAYVQQPFAIPTDALTFFLAPAAVFLLTVVLSRRSAGKRSPWPRAFLAFAGVLLAIAVSRHVTTAVPQPAHWTRVYLVASIALAALTLPAVAGQHLRRVGAVTTAVVALGVLDSALAIGPIRDDVVRFNSPAVLDDSQYAVVDELSDRPASLMVYLRECDHADYVPGLEYAVSALTPQRVVYGHAYFSPNLAARARIMAACPAQKRPFIPPGAYIVSDPGVAARLPLEEKRQLGIYEFGVLRP